MVLLLGAVCCCGIVLIGGWRAHLQVKDHLPMQTRLSGGAGTEVLERGSMCLFLQAVDLICRPLAIATVLRAPHEATAPQHRGLAQSPEQVMRASFSLAVQRSILITASAFAQARRTLAG